MTIKAPGVTRNHLLLVLAVLIPALIVIATIDTGLRTTATPNGIVSFEFCGFAASCDAALQAWGNKGRELAMLSIGFDFLFMLSYAGAIAIGLWLLSKRSTRPALFAALGWAALSMVIFDGVETALLGLIVIQDSGAANGAPYGFVAAIAASIKFFILAITLPTLLLTPLARRLRSHSG